MKSSSAKIHKSTRQHVSHQYWLEFCRSDTLYFRSTRKFNSRSKHGERMIVQQRATLSKFWLKDLPNWLSPLFHAFQSQSILAVFWFLLAIFRFLTLIWNSKTLQVKRSWTFRCAVKDFLKVLEGFTYDFGSSFPAASKFVSEWFLTMAVACRIPISS